MLYVIYNLFLEKHFSRAESGYSSQLSLSSGSTSSDYLIDSHGGVTSEEKSTEKSTSLCTLLYLKYVEDNI